MRRRLQVASAAGALAIGLAVAASVQSEHGPSALSAAEIKSTAGPAQVDAAVQNRKLGRGVNIIGYDPIWRSFERGRFKARHFRLIKQGGFDTVRINLHPFRHMDPGGDHALSRSWLEVLDWAVEQALRNDLMVILDLHEFNTMGTDPEGNRSKFLAFRRQIAPRYRGASPNLVFELLNEPSRKLTPELWNIYYREALAIIRRTNPTRTVIVGPPSWNSVKHLDGLNLPAEDRNLIVTVHYYTPMDFTHQGASWAGRRDKTGVEWRGTPEERAAIAADFRAVQQWSKANGRPILLGEFGAYDKGPMDSRAVHGRRGPHRRKARLELGLLAARFRLHSLRHRQRSMGRADLSCPDSKAAVALPGSFSRLQSCTAFVNSCSIKETCQ